MKRIISIVLSFIVALCPLAPCVCAKEYTDVTSYEGDTVYATREQAIGCFVNALGVEKFKVDEGLLEKFADKDRVSYPYIDEMATAVYLGLINGYEDNSLKPQDKINRAEALVILNRALSRTELSAWYDIKFSDTPQWAEKQINRLASAGIVKGYGDGTVGAKDYLTIIQVNTLCDRIERVMGPMGDFYSYVNGKWLEETEIPEGAYSVSDIGNLSDLISERLTDIIFSLYKKHYNDGEVFEDNSNEEKIITVYSAVANQGHRDKIGITPIKTMIDIIDKVKTKSDLLKTMAELERNGFSTMIKVSFDPDVKGNGTYLPAVAGSYTGLNPNLYGGEYENIYKEYIKELFEISGEENSKEKAEKAVGICKVIAGGVSLLGNETDLSKAVSVYGRNDLGKLYGIDMGKYFSNVGFSKTDKILLYDENLAKTVASVIKNENTENIKAYLKASVLDASAMYLNTDMFKAWQDYQNKLYGENYESIPSDYGTDIVQNILGWELGELYVEKYFSENSKNIIDDMTKDIIEEYKKLIKYSDRMTTTGKNEAIKKLENIKVYSAYPDDIESYKRKISFRSIEEGGNLMEYRMLCANEYVKSCNDILNGKEEIREWHLYPQTVNAMYDHTSNSITIPAGILQVPFFEASAEYEENLGGIGAVIAHEISHAFDGTGAQFDENGKLKNWWTEQDKIYFDALCQKIINEYDGIKYNDTYIDGEYTLNENLSDIAGISCIISLVGEDNEKLGDMFEGYAKIWRIKSTEEYDKNILMTDNHSPNKVRVNRVLSNFEAFENYYKIKEGDGMYIPDENKIDIWG